MRIKVTRTPAERTVDGIDLRQYRLGCQYDLGTTLATLFLAEGWAVPVADEEPADAAHFSDEDPYVTRVTRGGSSTRLTRETYPASVNVRDMAADSGRRRKPRSSSQ